jgi:DNA polymerase III subunit beta
MYFEIDRDLLHRSVNIADSIVSSKNVSGILSNCLFMVTKGELIIISTDNEIGIRTSCDAVADSTFAFTLNGKLLSQILKEMPKGLCRIEIDETYSANISSLSKDMNGNFKIVGTSRGDYPEFPDFDEDSAIEMDQVILKSMIKKVVYAASTDAIKPVFNGVLINFEGANGFVTVASDSRRLSLSRKKTDTVLDLKDGIIIPLKTINEIFKLLNSGICKFSVKGNQCFFKVGETEIFSRLIDGQFPNYKQVIPREYLSSAVIDTKKFTESLKRVMVLTREPSFKVALKFSKDKLVLEAKTPELGESIEKMEIDYKGDELLIGINSQYVMESIREIETLAFKMSITGQMSPVVITPENSEDYLSVIMPLQLKNAD